MKHAHFTVTLNGNSKSCKIRKGVPQWTKYQGPPMAARCTVTPSDIRIGWAKPSWGSEGDISPSSPFGAVSGSLGQPNAASSTNAISARPHWWWRTILLKEPIQVLPRIDLLTRLFLTCASHSKLSTYYLPLWAGIRIGELPKTLGFCTTSILDLASLVRRSRPAEFGNIQFPHWKKGKLQAHLDEER
jgi:hypothetical protein